VGKKAKGGERRRLSRGILGQKNFKEAEEKSQEKWARARRKGRFHNGGPCGAVSAEKQHGKKSTS